VSSAMEGRVRSQKVAVYMILITLVLFFSGAILVQELQAVRHGYGSGFSHDSHVPPQILRQAHLPPGTSAEELAERTMVKNGSGFLHDTWRIALTFVLLALIILWWYTVISRLAPL
jgi:hypothetical protein